MLVVPAFAMTIAGSRPAPRSSRDRALEGAHVDPELGVGGDAPHLRVPESEHPQRALHRGVRLVGEVDGGGLRPVIEPHPAGDPRGQVTFAIDPPLTKSPPAPAGSPQISRSQSTVTSSTSEGPEEASQVPWKTFIPATSASAIAPTKLLGPGDEGEEARVVHVHGEGEDLLHRPLQHLLRGAALLRHGLAQHALQRLAARPARSPAARRGRRGAPRSDRRSGSRARASPPRPARGRPVAHSRLILTRWTPWRMPFSSTRSARSRVGSMFSRRLASLISSQISQRHLHRLRLGEPEE